MCFCWCENPRFPVLIIQGLWWMRDRELGRDARPHPEFVPIEPSVAARQSDGDEQIHGGVLEGSGPRDVGRGSCAGRLWVNVADGMVSANAPARCQPVRGGMLCDEPGLGKTITVLALLLRTRGLLPGEDFGGRFFF